MINSIKKQDAGINCGVSCNLDKDILQTCLPLWESEVIDSIEWSFDAIGEEQELPIWFEKLISAYAKKGKLIGHGIFYSLFSGRFTESHRRWLSHLRKVSNRFKFDHFTEHFGFMTGTDFHTGAPMSIPMTSVSLELGRDRLKRLQDACQCSVGLENLAFGFSLDYVREQGVFLDELLKSVNGFIILDLHNLYCQSHNFNCSFEDLMVTIPLDRVREIHISGGSWDSSYNVESRKIRRDTHDDSVPEAVFEFLPHAIKSCSNLKYVILEQVAAGLKSDLEKSNFQSDFQRMKELVSKVSHRSYIEDAFFRPLIHDLLNPPLEAEDLFKDQKHLSDILENSSSISQAKRLLELSSLAQSAWKTEHWDDAMLHTAINIAQKWKRGYDRIG